VSAVATKPSLRRGSLALAALVLAAIMVEIVRHRGEYWQLAAFGLGPDLALLLGAGRGLAPGQLHPRAVRLYNLVHRFWGPIALLLATLLLPLSTSYVIGGLAWAFHLALDRSLGYGLRTADGFQRR
jgi:hypothetical protein